MSSKIQKQIKLPLNVAFGVAAQGIRVRFGRSVVTITGVMLGIAFLMAILTGQIIKSGVAEEQALRQTAKRMFNFLVAETGPPREKVISIYATGKLNRSEQRLLNRLVDAEPGAIRLLTAAGVAVPGGVPKGIEQVSQEAFGADLNAMIVMGDGDTSGIPLDALLEGARYKLICISRLGVTLTTGDDVRVVSLERKIPQEELDKLKLAEIRNRARNIWIIVISLLVTVIGITNSMLMSVTERFREIGTMKCLGALSAFIRQLFLIESSFIGAVGALGGALVGMFFSTLVYTVTYGGALVFHSLQFGQLALYFVISVFLGVFLSVVAALYPARFASKMLPAHALRSNI